MEITYSTMRECGLIDDVNSNVIIHPTHNMIIPLTQVNMFLFGVNTMPHMVCTQSVVDKKYIISYNNIYYLILSKLKHYIDMFDPDNLQKYQDKYILINFNNMLNIKLEGLQSMLYTFYKEFILYLNKNKPLFYNIIKKMFGEKYFKGRITCYEPNTNVISILFNSSKPIVVHFGLLELNIPFYVNLSSADNNSLYEEIKKHILLQDPDQYIVNNLATFMDISIARLIVTSHNNKMEHVIPLEQLLSVTVFKSEEMKMEYIDFFASLYEENTIWCYKDNIVYLNFDGLNKYFLNLELKYLDSFEMKDTINTFYSMIMSELIECYKYMYSMK